MHALSRRLLRPSIAAALAMLALGSCTDERDFTRPSSTRLYTTPTGLVTANPPQIVSGAGDISTCGNNNDEATARLLDALPGGVFTLGDNVMPNGATSEFANCYEPTWGRHKARTRPAAGNHDYNTSGAAGYFAYFGAAAGEPGKGYYSYTLGAWHVVVLNSNIPTTAGSAQDTWLKADLTAHPNQCTLAYYHHPLYSSTGGSGSGGATYSGVRNLVSDLYAGHADLILNGHRHFYERLAPMKPDGTADPVNGVREIIAGTGGDGGGTLTNIFPLSEARNGSTFGVLKLYLYDDSYAWKFIPVAGKTFTDSGSTACHFSGSGGGGGGGGGGVSATNSTVAASPTSFTAGSGSSTITVTARDGNGSTMSGATVTLTVSGSGNTLTPSAGSTDGSGVFTSTLTSSVAEVKTVSATINSTPITQTAQVTVNPSGGGGGGGTIGQTLLTSGASATNGRPYTTASIAPAANALVTIAVLSRLSTGAVTPTVSGGGMTSWTQVASVDYDLIATPAARLVVFRAMSASPGSGAITLSFANSMGNAQWVVSQWTGVDQSGTNGSGAIGQIGRANGNSVTALAKALGAFGNANNVAYGLVGAGLNGPAVTPGAGFAEITETSTGEKTLLESQWATNLTTVQGSLSSAANAGLLAIELVAGGGGGPSVSPTLSTVSATSPITAGGAGSTITVTAMDGSGNPISGATVVLSVSGTNNTLTPIGLTDGSGMATSTLTSTKADDKVVTATINGVAITQQASVTVAPAPAAALTFTTQPSTTQANAPITPAVAVEIRDAYGNRVNSAASVGMAFGTNPGSGTLAGTLPQTAVNGVATFSDLAINNVANGYTLTASSTGLTSATSSAFNVTLAVAISHTLLTSGNNAANGHTFTTASIAPAANALVTLAVLTHASPTAAPDPTVTGGGMSSWVVVASLPFGSGTPLSRLTIYRAMSASPGSGPITIYSSPALGNLQWVVSQWTGVDNSGTNGAGAIVQTGWASGTALNGLSVTLAAFANASDVALGVFGIGSNAAVASPGAGFTTVSQVASGESTVGDLFAEWVVNRAVVNANWSNKDGGALGLEIRSKP